MFVPLPTELSAVQCLQTLLCLSVHLSVCSSVCVCLSISFRGRRAFSFRPSHYVVTFPTFQKLRAKLSHLHPRSLCNEFHHTLTLIANSNSCVSPIGFVSKKEKEKKRPTRERVSKTIVYKCVQEILIGFCCNEIYNITIKYHSKLQILGLLRRKI